MKPTRRSVAAAAMVGSLVAGGAAGAVLFGPNLAGAQTTTTPAPGATGGQNGTFKSNEDPAHEANESAEQEAAEDAGKAFGGRGGHGPNEDAAHEANETPEREAAEDAAKANGGTPGTTGSRPGAGTGVQGSSTRGASPRIARL